MSALRTPPTHLYVTLGDDVLTLNNRAERVEARRLMREAGVAELMIWQGGPEEPCEPTGQLLTSNPSHSPEDYESDPLRMPPKPVCFDGCPGWDIFDADGVLTIMRCDQCWEGVADAPDDSYYQARPECAAALPKKCEPFCGGGCAYHQLKTLSPTVDVAIRNGADGAPLRGSPMHGRVSGVDYSDDEDMPRDEDIANALAAIVDPEAPEDTRDDAHYELDRWCTEHGRAEVQTYRDAGILTSEAGFVLRIGDTEYQITVTSRPR